MRSNDCLNDGFFLDIFPPCRQEAQRRIHKQFERIFHARNRSVEHCHTCSSSASWWAYMATVTLDFLLIFAPTLLCLTVLADWVYELAFLLVIPLFFILLYSSSSSACSRESMSLRSHISSYRVAMMVVTCLCILAVDFRIFPRRYAKTEAYGTSVMDLGVGSFVLVNALVSHQAQNASFWNVKSAIKSTSPLLFFGFCRFLSTRTVDYQLHVGEYGVHWNFFFTLAAVTFLASFLNVPPKYSGILGSVVLVGYQYWLLCGLNMYLISDKRGSNVISKNKEGIYSIPGYWGMYLVGVQLGYYLFYGSNSMRMKSNKLARIRVSFLSIIFWLMTVLLDKHVERVSRRVCNMSYVSLVIAQNLQTLAILMLSDSIPGSTISALEEATNHNLLGTFLLANMLTGLINLSVSTISSSSISALSIMLVYGYGLSFLAGTTFFYGFRLKFW